MFGKRLRALRKENKLTQKALGEKINISERVIGYYESGDRFPDEKTLRLLAHELNQSIDYLLGITDERKTISLKGSIEENSQISANIKIEYINLAKEMQDKKIPPDDIKKIIEIIYKNN